MVRTIAQPTTTMREVFFVLVDWSFLKLPVYMGIISVDIMFIIFYAFRCPGPSLTIRLAIWSIGSDTHEYGSIHCQPELLESGPILLETIATDLHIFAMKMASQFHEYTIF
jgi:hypothetical protein